MTASCYWRGSELEDSLFRWRYTSVPYLLEGRGVISDGLEG